MHIGADSSCGHYVTVARTLCRVGGQVGSHLVSGQAAVIFYVRCTCSGGHGLTSKADRK